MEQNAADLLVLFGAFVVIMSLPIVIGIVAVIMERE